MITVHVRIFHRYHALAAQTELTAGLCSLLDFADHISVQCRDTRFTAKDCRCVWNLNRRLDVHSAPFKAFLFFYIDLQKQIAAAAV